MLETLFYFTDIRTHIGTPTRAFVHMHARTYIALKPRCGSQVYRQEAGGSVTYARGCRSNSRLVGSDTCDDYATESCSSVDLKTVSKTVLFGK